MLRRPFSVAVLAQCVLIKDMHATAGRDRLEAEAERQQQGHKHSCSDMQMSMSGDVPSSAATTAMRTSKDGEPIATQPGITHIL